MVSGRAGRETLSGEAVGGQAPNFNAQTRRIPDGNVGTGTGGLGGMVTGPSGIRDGLAMAKAGLIRPEALRTFPASITALTILLVLSHPVDA